MKTKQTKIDRSGAKWLPGAMALAATTAGAQAATVQITLVGNKISSTGGISLNADLTGDGVATDGVEFSNVKYGVLFGGLGFGARFFMGGGSVAAQRVFNSYSAKASSFPGGAGTASAMGGGGS
jgi:hypothetical protein